MDDEHNKQYDWVRVEDQLPPTGERIVLTTKVADKAYTTGVWTFREDLDMAKEVHNFGYTHWRHVIERDSTT